MRRGFHLLLIGAVVFLAALPVGAQPDAPPAWAQVPPAGEQVRQLIADLSGDQPGVARRELETLADTGDDDARYALAWTHATRRLGAASSPEQAERLLQQGVERGHPTSVLARAIAAEAAGNEGDALYFYNLAAELDEPLAMVHLGRVHEAGKLGLGRNQKLAARFFRQAHETGLVTGTYELGRCYLEGVGVSPDALTAVRLIREAAEGGYASAQVAMAQAYATGVGTPKDNVAAVGWLHLAAQNGSAEAKVMLGIRYETGDGVLQDYDQAGRFYTAASQQGDRIAHYRLALLYIHGRGTRPDPVRGYVLLSKATDVPAAEIALRELEPTLTPDQLAAARAHLAEADQTP